MPKRKPSAQVKPCECPGGPREHASNCWARPADITINRVVNRQSNYFMPYGTLTKWSAVMTQFLRELRAEQDAQADAARICECGAKNARDTHSDTCWARPAGPWPFQDPAWRGGKGWWFSRHDCVPCARGSRMFKSRNRYAVSWGGFMRAELRAIDKALGIKASDLRNDDDVEVIRDAA